ncbi:MAG: serine kinase [candidate division NC10 bacterium]|nr:serine kinase [candidate division NC10 bacterium]
MVAAEMTDCQTLTRGGGVAPGESGSTTQAVDAGLSRALREALEAWHRGASAAGGSVERSFMVAGYPVRLHFAGPALVPRITRALAHLSVANGIEPELTIYLGDAASTGMDLTPISELAGATPAGAGWIHLGNRGRARFQPAFNMLNLLDLALGVGLLWVADARELPYWETSSPLRYMFHWWMEGHERQLVHAGAVGTRAGGVLLVGKAGSGKSTAALSCLESRLEFGGDDYQLVSLQPFPFAFSLYNSAKLEPDNIQRFPHLRPAVANADRLAEEKAIVFIYESYPNKVSPGFPVRGVLVPSVTHRRETRVIPTSPASALAALAPSTIFQLRDPGQRALEKMARLLEQVPSFTLELGTDLPEIPGVISRLLEQL